MKIRINDSVLVRAGKDRGKTGTVTKVLPKKNAVIVDGINKCIKHVKAKNGQAGERVEFFGPIDASNVALADPKDGKATRVGYKFDGDTKTRIAKRSGETIVAGKKAAKKESKVKK